MENKEKKQKAPRKRRRILWIVLAVLLLLSGSAGIYAGDYYHAEEEAFTVIEKGVPGVQVKEASGRIIFAPEAPKAGLIFYPGGKVEYSAYAPLMAELAQEGFLCVLLKMPLNLAVLNMDAAHGIPAEFPGVERWILAGHSLGGAMAASCAAKHPEEFDGLLLLAAYSTADLSDSGLRVLSLYGSEDGVLNREKYEKYRGNLPADVRETVIEGGCHAGFGAYGPQKGDGAPRITRAKQIARTAEEAALLLTGR